MIDRALGIVGVAVALIGWVSPFLWPNMHKNLARSIFGIGIVLLIAAAIVACWPESKEPLLQPASDITTTTVGNNNSAIGVNTGSGKNFTVINQSGSIIAPSGGINTVINHAPEPPPHITWEQEDVLDLGRPSAKVTVNIDGTLPSAMFFVTCDRPCHLNNTGTGNYGMVILGESSNQTPNKFTPIFAAPKPMAPGYLWLFVVSDTGGTPRITNIEPPK